MDTAVQDAINKQIRDELFSGYMYLSMSAHFEDGNLPGFAHWMRLQAQEELEHAMRLFDYMNRRGGRVVLQAVDQPPVEFGSALSIFEQALEHERFVTGLINKLYELSAEKGDWATQQELQWFIAEQVEEEDSAGRAVDQLRMAADDSAALLMLDQQFAARTLEGEGEAE